MCSNLFAENRWTQTSKFTTLSLVLKNPLYAVLLVKPVMGSDDLAQVLEVCFPFVGLHYLTELLGSAHLLLGNLSAKIMNSCELRAW